MRQSRVILTGVAACMILGAAISWAAGGGTGLGLVESSGSPYSTAIGYSALAVNTGTSNSAAGYMALNHNTTGMENTATGYGALYWNSTGYDNTAAGVNAMIGNTTGYYNAGFGASALFSNSAGYKNTAVGVSALSSITTSHDNTALGFFAGMNATTGSYNVFIGSNVVGTSSDANTIRIGIPYSGGTGQNKAFVAGIRGASVANAVPVVVDANGQLGTADVSGSFGIGTAAPSQRLEVSGSSASETALVTATTAWAKAAIALRNTGNIGAPSFEWRLIPSNTDQASSLVANYIGATAVRNILVIKGNGRVGMGRAPSYPLHMKSGAYVSAGGVWTNASSRSLKQDIAALPLERALAAVRELAPVTYAYKADPGEQHVGFIAEDVPELVATRDRTSLSPMDVVAVLTKVVQAQEERLAAQEARIAALERRLAATAGISGPEQRLAAATGR